MGSTVEVIAGAVGEGIKGVERIADRMDEQRAALNTAGDAVRQDIPDPVAPAVRLECVIMIDGVSFILTPLATVEHHTAEEFQRAAVKLREATVQAGAVWS